MSDVETPKTIEVDASPAPASFWSVARVVVIAACAHGVDKGYFTDSTVEKALLAVTAVGAFGYGQWKGWHKENERRRMAQHLPDRIATVKTGIIGKLRSYLF